MKKNANGFWTKERCAAAVLKFKSRAEIIKYESGCYDAMLRNGWIEELCSHIPSKRHSRNFWTYDNAKAKTLEYSNFHTFKSENVLLYRILQKNGWVKQLCSHMILPKGWTLTDTSLKRKNISYEYAKNCCSKVKCREELKKEYSDVYRTIYRKGWKELLSDIEIQASSYKRCVYAYEFEIKEKKYAYVGLTYNLKRRDKAHHNSEDSQVYRFCKNNGIKNYSPILKTDYIAAKDASKKEGEILDEYIGNGWIPLNIAECGGLGGTSRRYTYEICKQKAIQCKTRSEFYEAGGEYAWCVRNGHAKDIISLLPVIKKPNGYWTKERILEQCKKYKTLSEFTKNERGAYSAACDLGLLEEIREILPYHFEKNGYWTYEKCKEEAKKYTTRIDFHDKSSGAYRASVKNGWIDSFEWIISTKNPHYGKEYSILELTDLAQSCFNRTDFKKKYPTAYKQSFKTGVIDNLFPIKYKTKPLK